VTYEPSEPSVVAPLWGDVVRTEDGSLTLHSPRFGQTFRSRHGAQQEARHVFVEGAGVGDRLRAGLPTRVLEVGLGAATNLGQTASLAFASGTPVHYVAIEREPLPPAAWRALGFGTPAASADGTPASPDGATPAASADGTPAASADGTPAAFTAAWLAAIVTWSQQPLTAPRRLSVGPMSVDVWLGEAAELVTGRAFADLHHVDAIYLDPFSPEVDPRAWTAEVLTALAGRLKPGGVLATYSVQGAVRRGLQAAGLEVTKQPGPPGGKREVLRAVRPAPVEPDGTP
jgi:tRNA U34 5-methylaminomethyl-2-thiouridine-forming methyltransferase MnmC